MMKKMGTIFWICTFIVVGIIVYLTRQTAEQSMNLTISTEQNLPQAVVNPLKKQGFNVNTRQMAHVYEFFALGFFLTLALRFRQNIKKYWLCITSTLICLILSFLDQVHKTYVPARHFDGKDMIFDAIGYMSAIIIIVLAEYVIKYLKVRKKYD